MDNKIKITGKYYFAADSDQYVLLECGERDKINIKTKKPTGEIAKYEDILGYYSSLDALIRGCRRIIIREKVKDGSLASVDAILDYMNTINNKLDNILSKVEDY